MMLRCSIVCGIIKFYFLQIAIAGNTPSTPFCQMQISDVAEHNQVFTTIPSNYSDGSALKLLQTDILSAEQQLKLICKSNVTTIVKCQWNGTFTPSLSSVKRCEKPLPITTIQRNNSSCAPEAEYILFGYKINRQFLELYRVCYSSSLLKTYFAVHKTDHYSIVTPRPNVQFSTGGLTPTKAALMYKNEKIYKTFNQLLGNDQKYIPDKLTTIIARGHLAPSGDFPFIDQMKATFRYVNVVPQFHIINLSNWKKIENWVRQKANTVPQHRVQVVTGAHDILELQHSIDERFVRIYLKPAATTLNIQGERNELPQIPVPKWMYKIIKFGKDINVFVTYNNPYATKVPKPICQEQICPNDIDNSTWNDLKKGYTLCCEIDDFKKNVISTVPI